MRGFTLIELMVVMAIMAILVVVVVPSYNEYNNNQKLSDATAQLQTILRQAQNNAQTGTVCKITGGTSKATNWHVDLSNGGSSYSFAPTCETGTQTAQTVLLPSGVTVLNLNISSCSYSPPAVQAQFANISSEIKFVASGCPDLTTQNLTITLSLGSSNSKNVVVEKGGAIYVGQ